LDKLISLKKISSSRAVDIQGLPVAHTKTPWEFFTSQSNGVKQNNLNKVMKKKRG
jgi:hypothetical protein